jgi:D-inositol-3-phosphate glycosyltransferase
VKPRLLWIGDHSCGTGFARVSHEVLAVLKEHWEVSVLAINYDGDPTPFPYDVYPAWLGGDAFGVKRTKDLVEKIKPEVVVCLNDPWNIDAYVRECGKTPVIASLAVDALNCTGRPLNTLTHAIFWTDFGLTEARKGGFVGPASVIPLGVDRSTFYPRDRNAMRRALQIAKGDGKQVELDNAFIIGNVNRNQPRKRHDLLVRYFAEWVKSRSIPDAYLFMHLAPTGDQGWQIEQLMEYYGVGDRLVLVTPEYRHGVTDTVLSAEYATFDVMATCACEGWGLPHLEGMACGIPQIVPDWSALGDWPGDAVYKVPCSETYVTPTGVNTIMGIPDRVSFIDALDEIYRDRELREEYRKRSLHLISDPRFQWERIGLDYHVAISEAVGVGAIAHVGG